MDRDSLIDSFIQPTYPLHRKSEASLFKFLCRCLSLSVCLSKNAREAIVFWTRGHGGLLWIFTFLHGISCLATRSCSRFVQRYLFLHLNFQWSLTSPCWYSTQQNPALVDVYSYCRPSTCSPCCTNLLRRNLLASPRRAQNLCSATELLLARCVRSIKLATRLS